MAGTGSRIGQLRPPFEDVQAHYDLSDDFFATFLDPSRTYSCAWFKDDNVSLEQAQIAKIDLALDGLNLRAGMTLLDIDCGWGSTMKRAIERYDVNVIGLTLSRNQRAYSQQLLDGIQTNRSHRVELRGWEEFDEHVDRIVSIEAFEAFGKPRYAAFFEMAHQSLPQDGHMVLETILAHPLNYWHDKGIPITMADLRFMRFVGKEIFPGGQLPSRDDVEEFSRGAGFAAEGAVLMNPHYARTLDIWAANLADRRDDAIGFTSEEVYQRYQRYLTGCADFFRRGITEVAQFSFTKGANLPA